MNVDQNYAIWRPAGVVVETNENSQQVINMTIHVSGGTGTILTELKSYVIKG